MFPHTDVLKYLRSAPMSLANLQHETQVSLPTLRKAVQDLTDAHWIRIVGQAETNGGRPPKIYGLDGDFYGLFGVHLQLPGMRLIATDLRGHVLHEKQIIHHELPLPDGVLASVADYVQTLRAEMPNRHFLGIGIAAPGFIDPESGDVRLIGRVPGWQNFPICSRVEAQVGLQTCIANDIDCMAFVEFDNRELGAERNLLYVGYDEGAKASLFLSGAPYKGSMGNAGLIASDLLRVNADDDPQDIGAVLSIHGFNTVFERRVLKLPSSEQDAYRPILAVSDPRERFKRIIEAGCEGYPICREVVVLMTQTLAVAVANLIFILQPDVLVVGGALTKLPATVFVELEALIRALLPTIISHKIVLRLGQVDSMNAAAIGATQYLLEHHLLSQAEDLLQAQLGRL